MNCYNSAAYLRDAIESVVAQTSSDWEIVFWDNQSADDSAEIFRGYTDRRFRYFLAPEHTTLGEARNQALEQVRGEFIAFLDCDDLWMPEKLATLLPLFLNNDRVGLVYSDAIWFNNAGRQRRSLGKKHLIRQHCFGQLLTHYRLSLSAVIIRRRALDELTEWFDPRFSMIEEADLFRRIGYSWELDYVEAPLAKWRSNDRSVSWTDYDKSAEEGALMIAKFSKLYPEFDTTYRREKLAYEAVIARRRAISQWATGNTKAARRQLAKFIWHDVKNCAIYLMMLFPYRLYALVTTRFRLMANPKSNQTASTKPSTGSHGAC